MSEEFVLVRISEALLNQMRTRTEDGLAIQWKLGLADKDGVVDIRAFTHVDERTQQFRDAEAMRQLMDAPFWGVESIQLEVDYQEPEVRVEVYGYTRATGRGKTIEEACRRALAHGKEQ